MTTRPDPPTDNERRRAAKEEVRTRLELFKDLPPLQQLKFVDLVADEIVGAVMALTARTA